MAFRPHRAKSWRVVALPDDAIVAEIGDNWLAGVLNSKLPRLPVLMTSKLSFSWKNNDLSTVLFEIYIVEDLNAKKFFIKGKMKYEYKMKNNFDIQFFTIKQVFHKNLACLTSSNPSRHTALF